MNKQEHTQEMEDLAQSMVKLLDTLDKALIEAHRLRAELEERLPDRFIQWETRTNETPQQTSTETKVEGS